jgi:peptidoglycan/LPS O-acetylase OafA/YrhL
VIRDPRHRPQLDALRAFAVLGVLYTHLDRLNSQLGALGVRLFFVISGLLITKILLRSRESIDQGKLSRGAALKTFYIRRGLRIYPAYYTLLLIAAVFNVQHIRHVLLYHLLFASNFLFIVRRAYVPWVTAPFWSLSIEEQFYLLWPFVILLVPRHRLRAVIVATILLGTAFRSGSWLLGMSDFAQWFLPPASLDTLGAGALLALSSPQDRWPRWLVPAAVLGCALYMVAQFPGNISRGAHDPLIATVADTVAVLPMAAVTAYAFTGIRGFIGRILEAPPLLYIGRISFGIYLWHVFLLPALFDFGPRFNPKLAERGTTLFLVGSSLAIAVASVSWYVIEQPFNRLKRLFPYLQVDERGSVLYPRSQLRPRSRR